ncbi:MAG TPA: hypothetical protein VHN59_00975 [Chitinophagaceae bacterium]|nr:hypothetical protein [Chitinophagaceae bacterium]
MPDQYKKIDQVVWVVDNVSATIMGWQKLGFSQIIEPDTVDARSGKAGNPFKVVMAKANLGGANVTWIQPLEGHSVFSDFYKRHKEGIMSLVFRFDEDSLQKEKERLIKLQVDVLDDITFYTNEGTIQYHFEDTFEKGKYILGLTAGTTDSHYFDKLSNTNQHHLILKHYAFAIKTETLPVVATYWRQLGFEEILPDNLFNRSEKQYYGKPSDFELSMAWQEQDPYDYEWIMTLKQPTLVDDHLKKHGEGLQHLGFISLVNGEIQPLDRVLEDYRSQNIVPAMGASFGEKGKPGSGYFRMMDTDRYGGVTLELLWWVPLQKK